MAFSIENKVYYDYCDANTRQYHCLSSAIYYFTNWHSAFSYRFKIDQEMDVYDKKPLKSFHDAVHVFATIATIITWFILARVSTQLYTQWKGSRRWHCYLTEFVLIALPCIFSVNVANKWVEVVVVTTTVLLCLVVWRSRCILKAMDRPFELGSRPHVYTLLRSTVYLWTVLCILAIDFESFPHNFRKSRSYGISLMDVGIGLFVSVMAIVSKRLRSIAAFKHTLVAVVALFFLGTTRTLLVMFLSYGQDDHEYGRHLNAFFILGFTKLFGSLCSALARTDMQLLPLGVGILAGHELVLQSGVQQHVIDPSVERSGLYNSNREGLSSIPGFVALYLICIFIYKHINIKGTLNYSQFMKCVKSVAVLSLLFIFLTICSIFSIGISRVTCNFGYVSWCITITMSMSLFFLIVFELILNTLMPIASKINSDNLEKSMLQSNENSKNVSPVPLLTEAINFNGLVYFLIANFMTGFVNMFLEPESRSDVETNIILTIYLFLTTTFVFVLYCLKKRIA